MGERVLWKGTPASTWLFWRAVPHLLFMLAWFGFIVFWMTATSRKNGVLGPIGFFFLGFGILNLYRLLRPLLGARSTIYAVTTRRALTIEPGGVTSYTRAMMTHLSRSTGRGGRCNLVFATQAAARRGWNTGTQVGFWGISEGSKVERLIREEMSES